MGTCLGEIATWNYQDPTRQKAAEHLFFHRLGTLTSFTHILYTLISHADPVKREQIRKGFPVEMSVYEEWESSADEDLFFSKYGLYNRH